MPDHTGEAHPATPGPSIDGRGRVASVVQLRVLHLLVPLGQLILFQLAVLTALLLRLSRITQCRFLLSL